MVEFYTFRNVWNSIVRPFESVKKINNFCTPKLVTKHQQSSKNNKNKTPKCESRIKIIKWFICSPIPDRNTLLMKNKHTISMYCSIYHFSFTYTSITIVNIIDCAVVIWCDKSIILQKKPSKSQCKIVLVMFCHDNMNFNGSPTHGSFTCIKPSCFVPLLWKKIHFYHPEYQNRDHHKNSHFTTKNEINQVKYRSKLAAWFSPTKFIHYFAT